MSNIATLARPYARAAFAVAKEQGRLPLWSDLLAFSALLSADTRVHRLILHPKAQSVDLVELLLPPGDDLNFRDFLTVLADNGRLPLLPEIVAQYEQLRAEAERVVKARIVAAAPLEAGNIERLKAALMRRFGQQVEIETAVDPALIGGAVIDAGDLVIDGSVRGKLRRLQSALMH